MFALKPNIHNSQTKFALAVTIVVLLSACAQTRTKLGENEKRIIPASEFEDGGSWHDEYEPPVQYQAASRENFRKRVKKSAAKSRKSVVASGN